MLAITPLYASVLALMFLALSWNVVKTRGKVKVGVGDGGDKMLLTAIRAHGNFAEYIPFALILMILAELNQAPFWLLHGVGVILVFGRLCHATSMLIVEPKNGDYRLRIAGMMSTFTSLAALTIANTILMF